MDYVAVNTIHHNTRANEKSPVVETIFAPGEDVIGLNKTDIERLLKLGAIKPKVESDELEEEDVDGSGSDDGEVDTGTHSLTVPEAKDMIADQDDQDRLKALLRGEKEHPEHEGGRKGVIDALEERIGELEED